MGFYLQSLLVFALLSAELICARLLTRPQDLIRRQYDYVIVGGGTAGSVLANRLSENPTSSILVSNLAPNDAIIEVPFLVGKAAKSAFDWNYTTTPQVGFNNRSIPFPRGHVLGGSSSINFMFYTRGSSDDWDKFARITGDDGWSWRNIFQYFIKSERLVPPVDGRNVTGQFDPSVHGFKGPLITSLPSSSNPLDSRVTNTIKELEPEFPFNHDMNSGNPLGIGTLQSTIGNGARSSAATGYLASALPRSNLDILINTHVTKLLQTGNRGSTPIFQGVQFAQGPHDPTFTVTASKEVLLTAGSVGTPQLLMLSGIGDTKSLKRLGIKTIVNVPDVGKDMLDHPFVPLQWTVNSEETNDPLNQNAELLERALEEYGRTRKGPLANNPGANSIGFLRLPSDSKVLRGRKDPAAGLTSPHFEMTFGNSFLSFTQTPPTTGSYLSSLIAMTAPISRGTLDLATANPFDHPLVNPNMLGEQLDLLILTEAVKTVQRLVKAAAWNGYIIAPYKDSANLTSDAAIQTYIRTFATSFNHISGGAQMSSAHSKGGVVGPDLKVKGVVGLRIADSSVLPFIPGAHLQAVVYAISERAADLIKASSY